VVVALVVVALPAAPEAQPAMARALRERSRDAYCVARATGVEFGMPLSYGISARVYHPVHQISYPASPAAARFPEVAPVAPPFAFDQLH